MQKSTKIALISGSIIAFSGIVYFMYKKKSGSVSNQLADNSLSDLEKIYNQLLRTIGTQQQQPQTPQQLAAIKEAQAQEQAKSQFQPQSPQSQFHTQPQKKPQPQPQPQPQKPQTQEYKTQSGYYASGYGSSVYGSAGGGYSYGGGTNTGYSVYSGSIAGYGSNSWWLKDRGYGGIISDYAT